MSIESFKGWKGVNSDGTGSLVAVFKISGYYNKMHTGRPMEWVTEQMYDYKNLRGCLNNPNAQFSDKERGIMQQALDSYPNKKGGPR